MKILKLEMVEKTAPRKIFPNTKSGRCEISIDKMKYAENANEKIDTVQKTKENCMTDKQALKKARKIWGDVAWLEKSKMCSREEFIKRNPHSNPDFWNKFWGHRRHVVGVVRYGILREIKGHGITWEDAFENAKV